MIFVDDDVYVCCVCVRRQINNDGAAIDCGTFSHCVIIIKQNFIPSIFGGGCCCCVDEKKNTTTQNYHKFSVSFSTTKNKKVSLFFLEERSRWQ